MHGEHWQAIDGDAERTFTELAPRAAQRGRVHGKTEFDRIGEDGVTRRESATGLVYGDPPIGFFTLVTSDSEAGRNVVDSAYPFCIEGIEHEVTIARLSPWEGGLNGVVQAEIRSGAIFWFFDPFFYLSKDRYRVGHRCKVTLAALAMRLGKAEQDEFEIKDGPLVQIEKERALREDPAADVGDISMKFSIKGATIYLPAQDHPEEGAFRGVAEEVGRFSVEARGFRRIKTLLVRADDVELPIWLYASESILQGYEPRIGDDLDGAIWVQGHLA